ncbi:MAG: hypothetical protein RLZZ303_270 [Candidatus Hydrogenedentota bacterium]|jgi:signal peptidase I
MRSPEDSPKETIATDASAEALSRAALKRIVQIMIALLVVTIALRSLVVESCPVLGPSMEPTLMDGERVLVWKLPAVLSRLPLLGGPLNLEPGTLVVFERPEEGGRRYVKRVIACGNDNPVRVVFEQGRVYVDNQLLEEDYLLPEERQSPMDYETTLEPGQVFVLGDHRSVSKDSLRFGPIDSTQIIGTAFLRVWPPGKLAAL